MTKQDIVFELVKSMNKAEKRNFKLYANRSSGAGDVKFIALFDAIESLSEYDEDKILRKCNVKKEQIPNMKAHLHRQILVSLRLLSIKGNVTMQIREMIDFSRILFEKSLFRQSSKQLEKAKQLAINSQSYALVLEIIDFEKRVDSLQLNASAGERIVKLGEQAREYAQKLDNINALSNLAIQLSGLNLRLGYVRSERDQELVKNFFREKLDGYDDAKLSFHEKLYLYQARMWYSYIQYDFVLGYRYALKLVKIFDENDNYKTIYYDHYIRANTQLLDVLFRTRQYKKMVRTMRKVRGEYGVEIPAVDAAQVMLEMCLLFSEIDLHFMTGDFDKGVLLRDRIEEYLETWGEHIDEHHKLMLYYKFGCLYFGNGQYKECITYLQKVIHTRNPHIRRDLQVFSRMLNLIASYESGEDYSLDYQVKSVYAYIVKANDMHAVQHELITFLKRLPRTYNSNFRGELQRLYDHLKPLENHPYERRAFFYLDIISWLESKITGRTISEIIREKFRSAPK
ncbi:hypothetical protein BN938_2985 [Mucinivorans hirudinis]|uniref:Tetratricopeptide repeat protein n=1 Tax=Mucinivorans hirudinis TaxID=1433126 RepID=A0A060RBQ3_9BACT|nr:hypothetical protein BN938_2985 [Mucinivorans hirudinis]